MELQSFSFSKKRAHCCTVTQEEMRFENSHRLKRSRSTSRWRTRCGVRVTERLLGVTELQEQLGISEEAGISIEQLCPAGKERERPKVFEIFRQGEDVCIASRSRWNAQLKGLAEREKGCQNVMSRSEGSASFSRNLRLRIFR